MENYIANHDNADEIKKAYDELRLIGACHKVSYPTIKKWFLETYPEIAEVRIMEDTISQENDSNKMVAEKNNQSSIKDLPYKKRRSFYF